MASGKRCMFTVINVIITVLVIESQCRLHHLVLKVCVWRALGVFQDIYSVAVLS